jgi:hypothetical protein
MAAEPSEAMTVSDVLPCSKTARDDWVDLTHRLQQAKAKRGVRDGMRTYAPRDPKNEQVDARRGYVTGRRCFFIGHERNGNTLRTESKD